MSKGWWCCMAPPRIIWGTWVGGRGTDGGGKSTDKNKRPTVFAGSVIHLALGLRLLRLIVRIPPHYRSASAYGRSPATVTTPRASSIPESVGRCAQEIRGVCLG